ncbi:dihydrolipoamide acetyltransferase family protein [Aquicoccus sp. G2-2]|uniref:dihydrolipoamide acetyltransferase family protein n=1 Tax=Aquicoccus sp. G2-2 TaxID=3092120 RepID=UPI002ADFD564|nr:dihydrolipoamide acetyltransferase family protein [Aquicoccus sp. G2-2]MEA1114883.1 dihydrolipoamide acetyltransferase family protein [Aquicoccus sp. G2-2]
MPDLVMPKFGLTMTEGLLVEWHVAPKARFRAGDVLFTVETEKVANEVEAENDGEIAELLVAAGETVPVGAPVARLAGEAGNTAGASRSPAGQDSPSARKLMAEHGLARDGVAATGRGGRVMKEDVLRVIATPLARRMADAKGVDLHQIEGSGPKGRIKARDVNAADDAAGGLSTGAAAGVQEIAPDAVRLATARRVTAAKRDIPHFYLTHEAEVTALLELRSTLNVEHGRPRISVTHMLIRALGLALDERPEVNRIWTGDKILAFEQADIGMVVETTDGLRIPVIRDAGGGTLDRVAEDARGLAKRARDGELAPQDVGDAVISVSNVGMFGVSTLTPIVNPPGAMILGVGAERALFRPGPDGAPALRRELGLTLACDHRVVDGAAAARFLSAVVAILEHPIRLLRPARRPA